MSLPQAPESYQFRIEKVQGAECVFVKLMQRRRGNQGLTDYLVSEMPVSTTTVSGFDGVGDHVFISDVERAAQTLLKRLDRDKVVKELVAATWP